MRTSPPVDVSGWPEPGRRALAALARFWEPGTGAGIDPARVVVAVAPGRVNLLGGHTDQSEGFVLPVAVDRYAGCALALSDDEGIDELILISVELDDVFRIPLERLPEIRGSREEFEEITAGGPQRWRRYALGVILEMADSGSSLPAGAAVLSSEIPIGAGLSSSAAIECALYTALAPEGPPTVEAARLCRRAENVWAGVPCGIMDQYVSLLAEPGAALFLDCRAHSHRTVLLPAEAAVTVVDPGLPRALADSGYLRRLQEVSTALEILRKFTGPIETLRDVDPGQFEELEDVLPQPLRRRARHVVEAIARVEEGAGKLALGDVEAFGLMMRACHESLARNFEVSTPEIDAIVDAAMEVEGVWGARLVGGGFGGGCVVFHRSGCEAALRDHIARSHTSRFDTEPAFHHLAPVGGAHRLPVEGA